MCISDDAFNRAELNVALQEHPLLVTTENNIGTYLRVCTRLESRTKIVDSIINRWIYGLAIRLLGVSMDK